MIFYKTAPINDSIHLFYSSHCLFLILMNSKGVAEEETKKQAAFVAMGSRCRALREKTSRSLHSRWEAGGKQVQSSQGDDKQIPSQQVAS